MCAWIENDTSNSATNYNTHWCNEYEYVECMNEFKLNLIKCVCLSTEIYLLLM